MKSTLATLAVLSAGAALVAADTFYPIAGVTSDTSATDFFAAANLIEGSGIGFDAAEPHDRLSGLTWVTNAPNGGAGDYFSPLPAPSPVLVFDLGAAVPLAEISLWGYADTNGNGMISADLRFSMTPTFTGVPVSISGITQPVTPRQSFPLPPVTAQYVELVPTDNFFGIAPPGGDRVGLGEVAFAVQTVTPGVPDIEVASAIPLTLEIIPAFYSIPITNVGELALTINSVMLSGPNESAFLVDSFPGSIASLQTENVMLEFDPDGLGGPIEVTLTITSDDPDESPLDVLITGSLPALGPDIEVISPTSLPLGDVVESFFIDVDNVGQMDLTISGANVIGADAGAFTVIGTPGPIAAGFSDSVEIEFDPAGLPSGPIDATLQIMSNDADTPTAAVVLEGGIAAQFYELFNVATTTVNFFSEFNLISGSGFGFESIWPHDSLGGATWVTDAPNGAGSYYDNGVLPPVIFLDLGQDQALSEISTWGYANTNTNGGKEFSLRFATDAEGGDAGNLGDEAYGTSVSYNPTFEAAFSADTRDSHSFGETVTARYVEMTITTNWRGLQGGTAGGDRVGLGEVAFEILPPIVNLDFDIVDVDVLAGGNVQLTFESIENTNYELERSIDGENFTKLTDTAIGGAGATSLITDTDPLSGEAVVLYRVINTGTQAP